MKGTTVLMATCSAFLLFVLMMLLMGVFVKFAAWVLSRKDILS